MDCSYYLSGKMTESFLLCFLTWVMHRKIYSDGEEHFDIARYSKILLNLILDFKIIRFEISDY